MINIDLDLVKKLIKEQFPIYKNLEIKEVDIQGHDNRSFILGSDKIIRIPSSKDYAEKVDIEQKYLPLLAKNLKVKISKPLKLGKPNCNYPFYWSIYAYIEGKSLNFIDKNILNLELIAEQLAGFIKELHSIDIVDSIEAGKHNFYRGGNPVIYDQEVRNAVKNLENYIDGELVTDIWEKAIDSEWDKEKVWIHGDLEIGNILIEKEKIAAIIDFGGMAVGDPACDLVMAWTFFDIKSRKIFKKVLNLDSETWQRAKGWCLWKALITAEKTADKNSKEFFKQMEIIETLFLEK